MIYNYIYISQILYCTIFFYISKKIGKNIDHKIKKIIDIVSILFTVILSFIYGMYNTKFDFIEYFVRNTLLNKGGLENFSSIVTSLGIDAVCFIFELFCIKLLIVTMSYAAVRFRVTQKHIFFTLCRSLAWSSLTIYISFFFFSITHKFS